MAKKIKGYGRYKKHKYKSKYSKIARRNKKIADNAVNFIAVLLSIILALLVLNLMFNKKAGLKADLGDIAALNISYNDLSALKELGEEYEIDFPSLLAYYCAENDFFKGSPVINSKEYIEENFVKNFSKIKGKYRRKDIKPIENMFETLFAEIVYFPIPTGFLGEYGDDYTYGNSWGAKREYGGDRQHLGTDIADKENVRGRIPIISMTNGVIEHIGWNELGGYRIGIKTQAGSYYYYAHLAEFAKGLAVGSEINAGDLLGVMGDTGYSKKEGTTGNFIVHLHIGICYDAPFSTGEFWLNPYIFLRDAEQSRLKLD
ncbi:M23 family metallopeptidase [Tyzzerella sp. OttesenSCG-928-J15]|nr:M23 family metallopeptidase [Tyzzerella sp. OttesenSCG-928-J15]